jgi:deoxyhypusine synthase
VVELEESLNEGFDFLHEITEAMDPDSMVTSSDIIRALGDYLNENFPDSNGLLHAAARADAPIFIPAFTDSEGDPRRDHRQQAREEGEG